MSIKIVLAVVVLSSVAVAQTPTPKPVAATQKPASSGPAMTNDGVIKMVQAGLSEDLVIAAIKNASKKAFDSSPDGLVGLKVAGVSERILMMIVSGFEPPPGAAAPAPISSPVAATKTAPPGAASARESGFYVLHGGKEALLDPSVISGGKVGTFGAAMTGGIVKAKMKAVVRG